MGSMAHPSDSKVQSDAEAAIVSAAAAQLGIDLVRGRSATTISVGHGSRVEVDAASSDGSVLVEAYARQGRLKGAQLKKIAQDILKLALVGARSTAAVSKRVLVFASSEAERSVSGWVREAAEHFGVEFMVVEIPDELRASILRAQGKQIMVNVDRVADDVVPIDEPEG
jgi:hypothetical protein